MSVYILNLLSAPEQRLRPFGSGSPQHTTTSETHVARSSLWNEQDRGAVIDLLLSLSVQRARKGGNLVQQ